MFKQSSFSSLIFIRDICKKNESMNNYIHNSSVTDGLTGNAQKKLWDLEISNWSCK